MLRKVSISSICLVAGAVCACMMSPDTMLSPVGFFLVQERPIPTADALVVLLGQNNNSRTRHAAELFNHGLATKVVLLAGYHARPWYNLGDPFAYPWIPAGWDYRMRLIKHGVPENAIEVINTNRAFDTASELEMVSDYLREKHFTSVALVSSASHTRRLGLIWHRVAPTVAYGVYAAPQPHLDRWWSSADGRWTVSYEYGALVKEFSRRAWIGIAGN